MQLKNWGDQLLWFNFYETLSYEATPSLLLGWPLVLQLHVYRGHALSCHINDFQTSCNKIYFEVRLQTL